MLYILILVGITARRRQRDLYQQVRCLAAASSLRFLLSGLSKGRNPPTSKGRFFSQVELEGLPSCWTTPRRLVVVEATRRGDIRVRSVTVSLPGRIDFRSRWNSRWLLKKSGVFKKADDLGMTQEILVVCIPRGADGIEIAVPVICPERRAIPANTVTDDIPILDIQVPECEQGGDGIPGGVAKRRLWGEAPTPAWVREAVSGSTVLSRAEAVIFVQVGFIPGFGIHGNILFLVEGCFIFQGIRPLSVKHPRIGRGSEAVGTCSVPVSRVIIIVFFEIQEFGAEQAGYRKILEEPDFSRDIAPEVQLAKAEMIQLGDGQWIVLGADPRGENSGEL